MINFHKMCDKCFRMVDEEKEKMYAISLIDDFEQQKVFKGHKVCMDYLSKELPLIFKQEREAD